MHLDRAIGDKRRRYSECGGLDQCIPQQGVMGVTREGYAALGYTRIASRVESELPSLDAFNEGLVVNVGVVFIEPEPQVAIGPARDRPRACS